MWQRSASRREDRVVVCQGDCKPPAVAATAARSHRLGLMLMLQIGCVASSRDTVQRMSTSNQSPPAGDTLKFYFVLRLSF